MRARACLGLLAIPLTALAAGCGGETEAPAVGEFRKLVTTMRTGADAALAKAAPLIAGEGEGAESWRAEVQRHADAEQALQSMALQARELLRQGTPERILRDPSGATLYEEFLGHYERVADGYENLRGPYAELLEGLDAESGGEAGLGVGPAAVDAAKASRIEQMAKRSDQILVRYLEDRAQQSRTLRVAGLKLEGYEAARKGQAFMARRGIVADGAFTAVATEIEKLTAVE